MKLLYLANDFALPDNNTQATSSKIVTLPNSIYNQEKPRYTPVMALLILFVFAGFSLTIPLHPTRSALPNGCDTAEALPPDESAATCILQATISSKSMQRSAGATHPTNASYLVNGKVVSVRLARAKFSRAVRNRVVAGNSAVVSQFKQTAF